MKIINKNLIFKNGFPLLNSWPVETYRLLNIAAYFQFRYLLHRTIVEENIYLICQEENLILWTSSIALEVSTHGTREQNHIQV